jgi:hypothetical protein
MAVNQYGDISGKLQEAKRLVGTTSLTILKISEMVGLHRTTVAKKSRLEQWERKIPDAHVPDYKPLQNIVVPQAEKEYLPMAEIAQRRENAKIKDLEKQNKILLYELEKTSEALDNSLHLAKVTRNETFTMERSHIHKNEGCAIIQWSDWHCGERVELGVTNGLNEFNPKIAEHRVKILASNTVKLIQKESQNIEIKKLLICLGGDFINNYLHEHDREMNYMAPLEEAEFAKRLVKTALLTVRQYADGIDEITVMCVRGNHGRQTPKMQSGNDYKRNLEGPLYHHLKNELSGDIFKFDIPDSGISRIRIFDKFIRAVHGHEFKYKDGVGGMSIPANKYFSKLDATEKADFSLAHHYHSRQTIEGRISVNGSLVGTNSYSVSLGMKHQPPQQNFQLLDAKRGFTVSAPIFCE